MIAASRKKPERGERRGFAIHFRLALVVAASILPLWIATAIDAYSSYESRRARLLDSTLDTARLWTQMVDRDLMSVQAALHALSTSPAFDNEDFATAHEQAAELLTLFPGCDIVAADSSGQQILNTYRPFGALLPKRNARVAFDELFRDRKFQISDLFFGSVTKRPMVSIDVPVDVRGRVGFDLAMAIPVDRLGRILAEQRLPAHWVGGLIDSAGNLIAITRDPQQYVGQPASAALAFSPGTGMEGTFKGMTPDGVRVFGAFSRSELSGWTTVIDVPAELFLSTLKRRLWATFVGAMLSTAAAMALAAIIARRILRSNRDLEESEARFRTMADSSPAFIWMADREGRRFWFNKTWESASGHGTGATPGADWIDRIHKEDRDRVLRAISASVKDAAPWRCEYRLEYRDGSIHWILDAGAARRDASGRVLGFIGSSIDISDLKDAELELRRYAEIIDATGDLLAFVDGDHRYQLTNAAYARMLATTQTDLKGKVLEDVTSPDLYRKVLPFLARALAGEPQHQVVERMFPDGGKRTLNMEYRPFRVEDELPGVAVRLQDITERIATESELRIAAVAFDTQEGIVITDADCVIRRVNRAFTGITGFSAEEVIGRTPEFMMSFRYDEAFTSQCIETLHRGGAWQGELWLRCKSGEEAPIWLTVSAVTDEKAKISHYVGSFQDITERKEAEEKIRNLAFFDTLTGLPNRRLLFDRLQQALLASDRSDRHGALLFIDLDNFKRLNDTRGHAVGDLLLIEVARRLESCVRQADTVARLGGDEFVVILEHLDQSAEAATSQVAAIAAKIVKVLNDPYELQGHRHKSSPSIGITLFHGSQQSDGELLKQADVAMYQAKLAGRNRLCFFEDSMLPCDGDGIGS